MLTSRPLLTEDEADPFVHIHELLEDGRARVSEFLKGLSKEKVAELYARFHKLDHANFFAAASWSPMGNWFKNIGPCWEVGDNNRVRFFGFRDSDKLVLVNGCKKAGQKTPKSETTWCAAKEREYKAQPER